jgi:hypothetical protein
LLPVVTEAHVNDEGPLQPAGNPPPNPERLKPDMGLPSLEVNVMLTVRLPPTATAMDAADGVASNESWLPVIELAPVNGGLAAGAGAGADVPDVPVAMPDSLL